MVVFLFTIYPPICHLKAKIVDWLGAHQDY